MLGGLGLFLLGMIIMTDGLRALAGDAIRRYLVRFTNSPTSGAITGATSTAILQSSSATTVAAVGFVAAGLLSFPQALGIIFGANLGTTITGWMVALLGFKLKLGAVVLPLIFSGALLRLFAAGRMAAIGMALAGFGLIFVGISTLQEGMTVVQGAFSLEGLPGDSLSGRLGLLLFGILFTIITQSSSAGVATALSALHTDLITFQQAAALVVGMDVGTTITAAMATIGASTEARRTGLSHVIYNLMTGIAAFFLILPYTLLLESCFPGMLTGQAEIALVAFHTSFNALGVIAVLPFAGHFANLMMKLVPERGMRYGETPALRLLEAPELAIKAVHVNASAMFNVLLDHLAAILDEKNNGERANLAELSRSIDSTRDYLDRIHLEESKDASWERLLALIQMMDHLQRLHERCEEDEDRAMQLKKIAMLRGDVNELLAVIRNLRNAVDGVDEGVVKNAHRLSKRIRHAAHDHRQQVSRDIAAGKLDIATGTAYMEAIRWLNRVCEHIFRISHHLAEEINAAGK